jgi:hypothetical protein
MRVCELDRMTPVADDKKWCADCKAFIDAAHESHTNGYQTLARRAKAKKLVPVLVRSGARPLDAVRLTEVGWQLASELAGVHVPSAASKIEVVAQLADHWERTLA